MILAIKVDVDTYRGTREGLPRLLQLFNELGIRATFFLTHGPDNSGRAILKLLQRDFLAKMIRTRALRLYGLRTAFSGTLLPAPLLSRRCRQIFQDVAHSGHEVGVHGWDHRGWQDRVRDWSRDQIRTQIDLAFASHEEIFGSPPRAFAAPAWTLTELAMRELEQRNLLYTSSTRFGPPFLPRTPGCVLSTPEIPSTEICPEEAQTTRRSTLFPDLARRGDSVVVYPAHAEVEGGLLFEAFRDWLTRTLEDQTTRCLRLSELNEELGAQEARLPERDINLVQLAGRPSPVATGYPELIDQ